MKNEVVLSFLFFGVIATLVIGQTIEPARRSPSLEQQSFSAEDDSVERPVPLPAAIIGMLAADPRVHMLLEHQNLSSEHLPTSWFLVSAVHLKGSREEDIVVIGAGPVLGANVTKFWVFRPTVNGFEPILTVAAHDLKIRETRSAGYRDIETLVASGVSVSSTVYKFEGGMYRPSTDGR